MTVFGQLLGFPVSVKLKLLPFLFHRRRHI